MPVEQSTIYELERRGGIGIFDTYKEDNTPVARYESLLK
jgi:hypothetical protein